MVQNQSSQLRLSASKSTAIEREARKIKDTRAPTGKAADKQFATCKITTSYWHTKVVWSTHSPYPTNQIAEKEYATNILGPLIEYTSIEVNDFYG